MAHLLIVDEQTEARPHVLGLLSRAGHDVRLAGSQRQALDLLDAGECDLVLTSDRLGNASAFDIVEATRWRGVPPPVIVLAAEASNGEALEYLRAGAFDYLEKTEPPREIVRAVQRALDADRSGQVETAAALRDPAAAFSLATSSPALRAAFEAARSSAGSDEPMLIVGERGTGRRALARQIHAWSSRRDEPLQVLAAADLALGIPLVAEVAAGGPGEPAPVADCFSGAGTIVVSGIAQLGADEQRALAERLLATSASAGAPATSPPPRVRVLAVCEPGICAAVEAGHFRKDLYRSLAGTTLRLPPLRERGEDVIALAHHFLRTVGREYDRDDLRLSTGATAALARHWWPGNVRELRDAMERAVATVPQDGIVRPEHLPSRVARRAGNGDADLPPPTLEELERVHIARVLSQSETLEQAATTLGIHIATLWRKRRRYRLR